MPTERTAYVFVDELQEGESQIIFSHKKYDNPNWEVIEVPQKSHQQDTEELLLTKVKERFPNAEAYSSEKLGHPASFIKVEKK